MKRILLLLLTLVAMNTYALPTKELKSCGICMQLPKKNLLLPCRHSVCVDCLKPWLDQKVVCLQCQKTKQQRMKKSNRMQILGRVGLGMLISAAAIAAFKFNERLDRSVAHL